MRRKIEQNTDKKEIENSKKDKQMRKCREKKGKQKTWMPKRSEKRVDGRRMRNGDWKWRPGEENQDSKASKGTA